MANDKWGHKSLSLNISERGEKQKNVELISYHYVENDGYQFINRGSQRKIVINFTDIVTVDLLKFIISELRPSKGLKNILEKMVEKIKLNLENTGIIVMIKIIASTHQTRRTRCEFSEAFGLWLHNIDTRVHRINTRGVSR